MSKIVAMLFVIVGVINLLPLIGVVSGAQVARLYDITIDDQNLKILMRHRALLFGIVGALTIYAAFAPAIRGVAAAAAFVSMVGFIVIAWNEKGYNEALNKIVIADCVGVALLTAAVVLSIRPRSL